MATMSSSPGNLTALSLSVEALPSLRRRNGIEETVSTQVGYDDQEYDEGERRSLLTNWPIQKYQ